MTFDENQIIKDTFFLSQKQRLLIEDLKPESFYGKDNNLYQFEWIINCPNNDVLDFRKNV